MTTTRISKTFPQLTYMQYKGLPPNIQDEYLNWAQEQWEKQYFLLQFERQGGIDGIAKKKALQEVEWLERVTTWSYLHAYTPRILYHRYSTEYKTKHDVMSF